MTSSSERPGREPVPADMDVGETRPPSWSEPSGDRLRLLETQQIAGVGSWDWYVDTNTVVWTPELYRIHGLSSEDFDGTYESFLALVHPDDREHTSRTIRRVLELGEPFVYEHRILLPSGEVRTLESRGRVDRDENGDIHKLTGTCRDITERLRAEEELRQAHESYRSLIEAIPAISYIDSLRPRVHTVFVSPQVSDILGFDPSLVGPGFWRGRLHEDDRDEIVAARRTAYVRGEDFAREYRVRTADDRVVWVSDQAVIVRDDDGKAIFAQGIMYDISARKRLEDQLLQSQKMDALGRLAGGIAHDFNNLLTAILGNTQLLQDDEGSTDPHELKGGLREIEEAAQLGAQLVRQLLGFTRPHEGAEGTLDLGRALRSIEVLLRRVIGEDIDLRVAVAEARLPVRVELSQMTQVILNLVVNARDAMPSGGSVTLEAFSSVYPKTRTSDFVVGQRDLQDGPYAALRVTDRGTGIDEALLPLVFEPFFTTKERGPGGTGLGLSTVYGIVTRAKGFLTVAVEPGEGTSITAYFPLEAEQDNVVVLPEDRDALSGGEHVLVVEDDDRVRQITSSILRRCGYLVRDASDGLAGLRLAKEERFDVLLTDVVMPGMDGRSLAMKALEVQPHLAVLFMSGYAEGLQLADVGARGMAFIQKPFTREELVEKLDEVIAARWEPA